MSLPYNRKSAVFWPYRLALTDWLLKYNADDLVRRDRWAIRIRTQNRYSGQAGGYTLFEGNGAAYVRTARENRSKRDNNAEALIESAL